MAAPGLRQPWFTSTLMAISGPTASRTAATRLASSSGLAASPTLTFTVRNPSATCRVAAAAIAAGSPMLMTREICKCSRARPPSSCQRGIPAARATRSCSAMSSAALAAGTPSTRASSACERRLAVARIAADERRSEIAAQGFGRSAPGLTGDVRIGRRFAPALRAVTRADADQDAQGVRVAGVGNDERLAQRQANGDDLDRRDDHGAASSHMSDRCGDQVRVLTKRLATEEDGCADSRMGKT